MSFKQDLELYTPREEQQKTLDFIKKSLEDNPDSKYFLLNLPVGIGKSHLALMIIDFYKKNIDKFAKCDIITATKILQDQYTDTYSSINNLKGKDNYECEQYGCSCAEGMEFSRLNKTKCDGCPYVVSRDGFINGSVSMTNFYLYTLYSLYMPKLLESRGSKVLIVDEAHDFDDVMSNFISIKITEGIVKKLQFSNESQIQSRLKKVKSISQYVGFLEYMEVEIAVTIAAIEQAMGGRSRNPRMDKRENKLSNLFGTKNVDSKMMNIITDLVQYQSKIEIFLKEYNNDPDNWVLESRYNEKTKQTELSLEPIWAYDYLEKYVFSQYDKVFLMSGTILNKRIFCELNGLDQEKTVYYSINSPFDVDKRKIIYMPLGKMSYSKKTDTFKNYIPYLEKILKRYPKDKGLIHTNSFELAGWINNSIKDKRLVFHDSSNKDEVLKEHHKTDKPVVMVSPSMGTGISLDNESARFQVIAKVPYPSLASRKNKLRQKNNPDWYAWKTVSGIIQMSGRAVRSKNDWADTIIIDGSFNDLMNYSGKYFPTWFKSAIKRVNVKSENLN